MERAAMLPTEKRDLFPQRIAGQLELRWGRKFDDAAVSAAVTSAITGLIHEVA